MSDSSSPSSSSTTDIKSEVDVKKHTIFDGLTHHKESPPTETSSIVRHPEVSNFLGTLKKYGEGFVEFIDELHIQTVIFEPTADSNADITIPIISSLNKTSSDTKNSSTDSKKGDIAMVKGKVAAIYDTTMKLNGDVQNMCPTKIDPTIWNRHNLIVDQIWKSKIDTMIKIIDGMTGILKL
jgi:hypothetical protein